MDTLARHSIVFPFDFCSLKCGRHRHEHNMAWNGMARLYRRIFQHPLTFSSSNFHSCTCVAAYQIFDQSKCVFMCRFVWMWTTGIFISLLRHNKRSFFFLFHFKVDDVASVHFQANGTKGKKTFEIVFFVRFISHRPFRQQIVNNGKYFVVSMCMYLRVFSFIFFPFIRSFGRPLLHWFIEFGENFAW